MGVTRDTVIQIARRELDRITRERVIDRTELYTADEIFLTGTGAQIAPVISVDHRPIGTGEIGQLARDIQRIYGEVVRGQRPEYMEWCTPSFAQAAPQTTRSLFSHAGKARPGKTAARTSSHR